MRSLMIDNDFGLPIHETHISHVLRLYPRLEAWRSSRSVGMSLEDFMVALEDRPTVRKLPITIACADLPSAHARTTFGTHSYDTSLRILQSAFTAELCTVIRELFPNVSTALVSICTVSCLLSSKRTTARWLGLRSITYDVCEACVGFGVGKTIGVDLLTTAAARLPRTLEQFHSGPARACSAHPARDAGRGLATSARGGSPLRTRELVAQRGAFDDIPAAEPIVDSALSWLRRMTSVDDSRAFFSIYDEPM
jgi:hypothetical protein